MRHEQALRMSLSEAPLIASFLLNKGRAPNFKHIEVFTNGRRQVSTLGHQSSIQYLDHWIREQRQKILTRR
jgi:hypothetical protein